MKEIKVTCTSDECLDCGVASLSRLEVNSHLEMTICKSCSSVRRISDDEDAGKMIDKMERPATQNDFTLCPSCWRELQLNKDNWMLECRNPVCGYSKRMPGLSPEQRELKKEYLALRDSIYKRLSSMEYIADSEVNSLKEMEKEVLAFRRFEQDWD